MSEYQYYEFRCIDKPLTAEEQKKIGRWSSRTHPTSTGAIFIYNYGDFPKDEKRVVEQYFDAMFYIANWGTKRLIFKFPKELMNIDSIKPYCTPEEITISESGQNLLLNFYFSVRLVNRLKELSKPSEQVPSKVFDKTIGNILSEADRLKKRRKEAARRKKEADRLKRLAELEANASTLWEEVYRHISEKKPQAYDVAITILQDLHMLAKHQDKQNEYEQHVQKILQEYSRLSSLKSKIIHAKLIRNM